MQTISCLLTNQVVSEENLGKHLKKKFMIFKPALKSADLKFVRCFWIVLDYEVKILNKKNLRNGTLNFIVDDVRGCSVIEDKVDFKPNKRSIDSSRIQSYRITKEAAIKKAIIDARWKVVFARFKNPPEIEVKKVVEFYRPYYEAEVEYKNSIERKMIPADGFANYFVYM